jgi:hypothetical protein
MQYGYSDAPTPDAAVAEVKAKADAEASAQEVKAATEARFAADEAAAAAVRYPSPCRETERVESCVAPAGGLPKPCLGTPSSAC